ncbi:serine/threonine-protein kinase [Nocardioides sp. Kera G14]|uniref:serine/threonine-protein kinase n=1 Tax=Nocardioides sp. Kera G14 TaxID=2884264 RepID=UPI001D12ACAC|nr:serine/threonine-protein kinase [Nocardioides sp. Kera G14]UDY24959.1 serine/threonine protein kinase [Nocardioides sp. Kera G14]
MDDGRVVGRRYLLGEALGRGGTADVYRATDRLLERPVAVKVLRESPDDRRDRARFELEARTLAGLSHPHLVPVLDAGMVNLGADERPYLVMELVEGPTLRELIQRGPMAPDRVRLIGSQVADALAYAHARGIVHRDVKPGNVLIGRDDQSKLVDFGIARLMGDTARHTQTGIAIGTAAYVSPEQVRAQAITEATDIYSLGLVLLEALTGVRAFPGPAAEAAIARLTRHPHIPSELPVEWRTLLTYMTAYRPVERPSAEEVAARLRGAPGQTGRYAVVPAAPAAPPPQLEPVRGRRRLRSFFVTGTAIAGLAAAAAVAFGAVQPSGDADDVSPTTPDQVIAPAPTAPAVSPAAEVVPATTSTQSHRASRPAPQAKAKAKAKGHGHAKAKTKVVEAKHGKAKGKGKGHKKH